MERAIRGGVGPRPVSALPQRCQALCGHRAPGWGHVAYQSLDHLVLTTADEQACIAFYVDLLGMRVETFGEGRKALCFGTQKINIHVKGHEFEPKAHLPVPGSLDLCLLADQPLNQVLQRLKDHGVTIVEGPVRRTGACGPILSIYLRDPDLNLIEISEAIAP